MTTQNDAKWLPKRPPNRQKMTPAQDPKQSFWKMLLNFRNGLDIVSIFPLFLELFDMKVMQNLEKKSEKFKLFFSRIFGTSYNHPKTILRWSGVVLVLRSVNYFFRAVLAPLKIM